MWIAQTAQSALTKSGKLSFVLRTLYSYSHPLAHISHQAANLRIITLGLDTKFPGTARHRKELLFNLDHEPMQILIHRVPENTNFWDQIKSSPKIYAIPR